MSKKFQVEMKVQVNSVLGKKKKNTFHVRRAIDQHFYLTS